MPGFTEHKITDRMLAMEDRVNEQNGEKIAKLCDDFNAKEFFDFIKSLTKPKRAMFIKQMTKAKVSALWIEELKKTIAQL